MTKPTDMRSKGFNLGDAIDSIIAGGSYDSVDVRNGAQKVRLTRFGGGSAAVDVKDNAISFTPLSADAGSISVKGGGKQISIEKGGFVAAWGKLPTAAKVGIIGGGAAILLGGVALVALR